MAKVVVVTDSSKLYQLARFCETETGAIKEVFLSGKLRGYSFVTTKTNLRRAWQAYERELKRKGKEEKVEGVKERFFSLVNLVIDRIISEDYYLEKMPQAEKLLQDDDYEKEDSQALALAIALRKEGYEVLLWTNDHDFLVRAEEIEKKTGVRIIKTL